MTYYQLLQNYLNVSYTYPPNSANQCGPCPQIVQPLCCPQPCCQLGSCSASIQYAPVCYEKKCKKKCKCIDCCEEEICEEPCYQTCVEIDPCCYGSQMRKKKVKKCKKKKVKPCQCATCLPPPPCPLPCGPSPCCPQPCGPNPCCDPNGANCNPIKGWPWITQTWGGTQRF